MATQLAAPEAQELPEQPQGDAQAPVQRDYEAEARNHGWTPKEEFKGDPSRWVDAETFATRADEVMPLLKKQNESLKREMEALKKDVRRASEHFSKAEERAYARALSDLTAKQDAAAEVGDVEAVRAVRKEIAELKADVTEAPPADRALEAREALIDWRERNPWYDKPGLARDFADMLVDKHVEKTKDMAPAEFFDFISGEVLKRYPTVSESEPARKPINPVEGAGANRRVTSAKGWTDMDPEERRVGQQMADRWVKSGLLKSRDDFLKTYDWTKK